MNVAAKTNLMGASREWASRPADQRYWGLEDLYASMQNVKDYGRETTPLVKQIKAISFDDRQEGYDSPDLRIASANDKGPTVKLTHWSLGQLARFSGAPAEYIRGLPAHLAAECINHGLKQREEDETSILLHRSATDVPVLRSMTTDSYSRLWNADLVNALRPAVDNGWMVPPARPAVDDSRARPATIDDIVPGQDGFGLAVKEGDMIAPAGVYASDHDMFIFMVNPNRIIDLDGSGGLMRGIFLWNSEVGAGAMKVQTFLLEAVCGNHIVWGASDVRTFRKVHKGKDFEDMAAFGGDMARSLVDYGNSSTDYEMSRIKAARAYVIGRDEKETKKKLFETKSLGLSQTIIDVTYRVAERFENTSKSAPTTAWGIAHALTRQSQATEFADERAKLDGAAGKLLQLAYIAKS